MDSIALGDHGTLSNSNGCHKLLDVVESRPIEATAGRQ